MKTYQALAHAIVARANCIAANNTDWQAKWEEQINDIVETFPRGSGFDNGTKLDPDMCSSAKLVFTTAFHHMNEGGMYDGWTKHSVTVTPDLAMGFHLAVGGRDRNDIKDYIAECFEYALNDEWPEQRPSNEQLVDAAATKYIVS